MPTFAGARHGMDRGEVEALPAIASAHPSMTGLDDSQRYHRKVHMKKAYMRSVHDYVLPELPLLTMSGSKTTLHEILDTDKPVMLNFIFTTCTTICPVLSATFSQVQNKMGVKGERVKMISISIDPEYDTPEVLRDYAKRFHAGRQWGFYTGDPADIYALERAFSSYRGAKMNHEPSLFLRAGRDAPWVRIDGIASADDVLQEFSRQSPR